MFKQMDIFDYIENQQELAEPKSMFEKIFTKINNPVMQCTNCLCDRCADNAEELWGKVEPDELNNPCFNCDYCKDFTGDIQHVSQRTEDCKKFILSEYAAKLNRKNMKLL